MLIDNALSPKVGDALRACGCDVVHVRELGLETADDATILARARADKRTVVSRDSDFAAILARAQEGTPSFLHVRLPRLHDPVGIASRILDALERTAAHVAAGVIVTIEEDGVRFRHLPVVRG